MKRLVLGAGVSVLALSACGGSHKATSGGRRYFRGPSRASAVPVAAKTKGWGLTVTVPRGLLRYDTRGGGHMVGTPARVYGVLATDDPGAHYGGGGFAKWAQVTSNGPPSNK